MSGILSVFYTIWTHSKLDYMNYCRPRCEFWSTIASTLRITRKDEFKHRQQQQQRNRQTTTTTNDENNDNDDELCDDMAAAEVDHPLRYLELFGFDSHIYENEMLRFDELILESNIKCVAYSFKIVTLEIFDYVYLK